MQELLIIGQIVLKIWNNYYFLYLLIITFFFIFWSKYAGGTILFFGFSWDSYILGSGPLNWESANTKIKREETRESGGGGACNHFFKRPVPVYQLLVYPLTGQIWPIISTLSKRVVSVTQRDACDVHAREIEESTITSVFNECLRDFPHMGALRKEQKTCLVNLARGKDVFVILPPGFGLAW